MKGFTKAILITKSAIIGTWLGCSLATGDWIPIKNIETYVYKIKENLKKNEEIEQEIEQEKQQIYSAYSSLFTDAKTYEDSSKVWRQYHIPLGREPSLDEKRRIVNESGF